MKRRTSFAAAGKVLGAVACIVTLAILAACGGGGVQGDASVPYLSAGVEAAVP